MKAVSVVTEEMVDTAYDAHTDVYDGLGCERPAIRAALESVFHITDEMCRSLINWVEDTTGSRLPDGDGEDYKLARTFLESIWSNMNEA